jgi:hypothetical protein
MDGYSHMAQAALRQDEQIEVMRRYLAQKARIEQLAALVARAVPMLEQTTPAPVAWLEEARQVLQEATK